MIATEDKRHPSTQRQLLAISRPIHSLLARARQEDCALSVRMLARFRRALNLTLVEPATAGYSIIALITPDLAIGPFHLMVTALQPSLADGVHPIWWEMNRLRIGPWALQVTDATRIWDPQPDWRMISVRSAQRTQVRTAARIAGCARVRASPAMTNAAMRLPEHHRRGLRDAVAAGDVGAVARHAAALSGCGPGLTPSGDDFLAGWMLALWATHHPGRRALCETICRSAQGRTTRLSLAFLEAARRGEADQRWHNLLLALSEGGEGDVDTIAAAMAAISSFGATSGVDMLDGFVEGISVVTQPTCGQ